MTATAADTLAAIGRELGVAFTPIEQRLGSGSFEDFLDELGLTASGVAARHVAVVDAMTETVRAIADLVPNVEALITAIEAEDVSGIASHAERVVRGIVDLVERIDALATAIDAAASGATAENAQALAEFAETFARRLLDFALIEYARARAPRVLDALHLLGLVDDFVDTSSPDGRRRRRREIHFDRILLIFTDPAQWLEDAYGWGTDDFDGTLLFPRVQRFVEGTVVPAHLITAPGMQPALDCLFFRFEADRRPTGGLPGLLTRLRVRPEVSLIEQTHALSETWRARLSVAASFEAGLELGVYPPLEVVMYPPTGGVSLTLSGGFEAGREDGTPTGVLTLPGGLGGLFIDRFRLDLGVEGSWTAGSSSVGVDPTVSGEIAGGKITLGTPGADSFLQSLLPEGGLSLAFDAKLSWTPREGLRFEGGVGLEIDLPLGLAIGPVSLRELHIGLLIGAEGLNLEASTAIGAALGPLAVEIERMGLLLRTTFPEGGGNAGPADLAFEFKPPSGVGLSIDAGVVTGAGYITLEPEIGRYSGFLSLRVSEFAVTALGLVQTNLPQPGPEFSLLILITATFPGIQVGYGLTLNGIGGIFGLHRRIDADALRGDVSSGAVSTLLDPGSMLDNPGQIIERLERYFPTAADHFVIGLSIQLRWVELVRLDLGVMIELPGPNKIVLLGRAKIAIESGDKALVRIQLEVLGIIDFEEKLLSIDAALRDSSLLEIFEITGGAAIRLGWGERPYAVMSIGGFHPEFVPEPAVVPVPDRVGLTTGSPDDWFYLRLATYVAITTGSFQLGAAVEVRINLEIISVEGMLAFDALIVFDPFYFSVGFSAAFRIRIAGITLAGVSMKGTISGPGPVTFAGEVCLEILFIKVCWSGSFSIGSEAPPELPEITSVVERLAATVNPEALQPRPSGFKGALLQSSEDALRFDPAGGLCWTQGLLPLGIIVERIEGSPLAEALEVDVSVTGFELEDAFDWFAPAAFAELTDAEAINRKSFERLKAGLTMGGASRPVSARRTTVELRPAVFVPGATAPTTSTTTDTFPSAVRRAALARGAPAALDIAPELSLGEEAWVLHGDTDENQRTETAAHQKARHRGGVALPAGDKITVGAL